LEETAWVLGFVKSVIVVFRFSVASNKLGYFIYGLQDRVWPDFVCHFSLYCGVQSHVKGLMMPTSEAWSTHDHIAEVVQRSPTRLNPNLKVMSDSAARDLGSSANELAKFGFSYPHKETACEIMNEQMQQSKISSTHI
jgi:hypothetical protein